MHRATREAAEKAAQIARVERDYLAGTLSGDTFERLTSQLTEDRDAATAERDRLAGGAAAVRQSRAELDAEGEALRRLADLRVAVLARVRSAEQQADVSALRAALAQAFSKLMVSLDGHVLGAVPLTNAPGRAAGTP